jgi:hypothetical protein
MKFRGLFKVRKPGNGNAFQKKAEAAGKAKVTVTNKPMSVPNAGTKKSV